MTLRWSSKDTDIDRSGERGTERRSDVITANADSSRGVVGKQIGNGRAGEVLEFDGELMQEFGCYYYEGTMEISPMQSVGL